MPEIKVFFDTNVVLYLLSADSIKANRAEDLLACRGVISIQVLNEFVNVALRKLHLSWLEINDILQEVRAVCQVEPLSIATHERALTVAQRYHLSFYDASIVAAALLAGCTTLYSEDMQHGQLIDQQLMIHNPFIGR